MNGCTFPPTPTSSLPSLPLPSSPSPSFFTIPMEGGGIQQYWGHWTGRSVTSHRGHVQHPWVAEWEFVHCEGLHGCLHGTSALLVMCRHAVHVKIRSSKLWKGCINPIAAFGSPERSRISISRRGALQNSADLDLGQRREVSRNFKK